ncbi:MAG: hypothetical protein ACR2LR_10190 [Hassallia sp.]
MSQTQAVPCDRHPLRQAQNQLSRCNLPRCYRDLAQLMTRPNSFIIKSIF